MTPAPMTASVGGHLLQLERAGGGDDALLVDVDALELRHIRARGDDDVLRLDHLAADADLAGARDLARSAEHRDLVLLQQEVDALGVAVDGFLLEAHHLREVDAGLGLDAHLREGVLRFGIKLRGVQQRLGGNAADVEAGAAMAGALLDHCHLEAQLGRADGADIAAGAGADDGDVELVRHGVVPVLSSARRPRE